jgi:hypothetical protein
VIVLALRRPPPLPSIELDSSTDKVENDAAWEARHLAMARCNSLMTVVTNVWEKANHARDAAEGEENDVRRAKRASIRPEMAQHDFVIVDYSDDESGFSGEDTNDDV